MPAPKPFDHPYGVVKLGWLKILKNSARNCAVNLSRNFQPLVTDRSRLRMPESGNCCAEARIIDTDWRKFNFQHVVDKPRLMSADDLNRSIREAWFEFYSVRRMVQGLGRTRAPVTKGNLTLWALNLGINKIMRRIAATSGPVRTTEMPMSVFDTLPPSSR